MNNHKRIKNVILYTTILLCIIDFMVGIFNLRYSINTFSLLILGYYVDALVNEHLKYKTKSDKFSKPLVFFSILLISLSLYSITRNIVNYLLV